MSLNLPHDWFKFLKKDLDDMKFSELERRMAQVYRDNPHGVFPPMPLVFSAFHNIPPKAIRLVILGQDPYPTRGHAHGLAFSVQPDVVPLPKSLKNIFKELQDDVGLELPLHGNLNRWRDQGVLLLNAVLTIQEGQPGSHNDLGWEAFSDAVIHRLSREQDHLVFLLWGAKAQQKSELIDATKHLILGAPHPSPLSAYRGFFGCRHFSKANEFLASKQRPTIAW
ncbi:MAG: uracil-DNA glycosylase [Bacteroidota bacterium]